MPELYPGQAEVVAGKLRQEELLQAADEERLKVITDPSERAAILSRMAGRAASIASQQRFVRKLTGDEPDEQRTEVIRLRLTPSERAQVDEAAAEAGLTLSQYVRARCGL